MLTMMKKLGRYLISGYVFQRNRHIKLLNTDNQYVPLESEDQCDHLKIAVYSVCTGNYDTIREQAYYDPHFDYYVVADASGVDNKIKILPVPEKIKQCAPLVQARYIKTHPGEILKGYDYTIFIDGNVSIETDVRPIINSMILKGKTIGIHLHQSRDCAYDESKVVYAQGRAKFREVFKQMKHYRKEGFPKHYGLFETNVLIRKMDDQKLNQIMDSWWAEMEKFTKRDQLSFTYALWKNGETAEYVYPIGTNSRKSKYFEVGQHN